MHLPKHYATNHSYSNDSFCQCCLQEKMDILLCFCWIQGDWKQTCCKGAFGSKGLLFSPHAAYRILCLPLFALQTMPFFGPFWLPLLCFACYYDLIMHAHWWPSAGFFFALFACSMACCFCARHWTCSIFSHCSGCCIKIVSHMLTFYLFWHYALCTNMFFFGKKLSLSHHIYKKEVIPTCTLILHFGYTLTATYIFHIWVYYGNWWKSEGIVLPSDSCILIVHLFGDDKQWMDSVHFLEG